MSVLIKSPDPVYGESLVVWRDGCIELGAAVWVCRVSIVRQSEIRITPISSRPPTVPQCTAQHPRNLLISTLGCCNFYIDTVIFRQSAYNYSCLVKQECLLMPFVLINFSNVKVLIRVLNKG